MRVLAFETATILGGIAIMEEERLITEIKLNVRTTHSERLMRTLDNALKQSSLGISDMDALAVSIGPGSFTGLRVGLSTVKGLAYATGMPVIAVPTLEAFAWNLPFCRHPVCTMLDARKKEVYAAVFLWEEEEPVRIVPETSIRPALVVEHLLKADYEKVVFMGEGALLYAGEITGAMGNRALLAPPHLMSPSASNVAYIGIRMAKRGAFNDPRGLSPFYIRRSEAELKSG
jgi:tRNA threonylcarbamoyladenosine biosynthesis protein TsaB